MWASGGEMRFQFRRPKISIEERRHRKFQWKLGWRGDLRNNGPVYIIIMVFAAYNLSVAETGQPVPAEFILLLMLTGLCTMVLNGRGDR